MKYFCVSDVHGQFEKLISALKKSNFEINNPEHILCVSGDFLDGGPEQIKLFRWLRKLHSQKKALIVRGNHDDFHVRRKCFVDQWMEPEMKKLYLKESPGISYAEYSQNIADEIRKFVDKLPYYIEKETFILVHAGINPLLPDWRKGPKLGFEWTDSMTWTEYDNQIRIKTGAYKNFGKKVITGHSWVEGHHHFYNYGYTPYKQSPANPEWINKPFEVDDFVGIDAKWHMDNSKGIVYIIEE